MENDLIYFFPIISNVLRYFLMAGLPFLLFYGLFPGYFTTNKIQQRRARTKDFFREIRHSAGTMLILSAVVVILLFSPLRAYTQIYEDWQQYGIFWAFFSLLPALIIHDTYFYWMHRIIHRPRWFKKLHLVHHRSVNPSPWASLSFNIGEAVLESLVVPLIVCLLPMHPLTLVLFSLISFAFNVYGHLGYEIAPRWFRHTWLFEVLSTSVYHNLHHERFKGNYGLYFRIWDRLLGTEHPEYTQRYDAIQGRRFGIKGRRRPYRYLLGLLLFFLLVSLSAKAQTSIVGIWEDRKGGGTIEIYKEDNLYHARLLSAKDPKEQAQLKGKYILILQGFKHEQPGTYCCGTIFQPRFRRNIAGELRVLDAQRLELKGEYRGFSNKRIWYKIE